MRQFLPLQNQHAPKWKTDKESDVGGGQLFYAPLPLKCHCERQPRGFSVGGSLFATDLWLFCCHSHNASREKDSFMALLWPSQSWILSRRHRTLRAAHRLQGPKTNRTRRVKKTIVADDSKFAEMRWLEWGRCYWQPPIFIIHKPLLIISSSLLLPQEVNRVEMVLQRREFMVAGS